MAGIQADKGHLEPAAIHIEDNVGRGFGDRGTKLEPGGVLLQRGGKPGSLDRTQWILHIQSRNAGALYSMHAIRNKLGNGARARECWERPIAIAPQSESGRRDQRMFPQLAAVSR